jgi:hypothetical protein
MGQSVGDFPPTKHVSVHGGIHTRQWLHQENERKVCVLIRYCLTAFILSVA